MVLVFTHGKHKDVIEKDVDAVDIISGDYRVAVRLNGVSVFHKTSNEPILKQELNLTK